MKFIVRSFLLLLILVTFIGVSTAKNTKVKEAVTGEETQVTTEASAPKEEIDFKKLQKQRKQSVKSYKKCKKITKKQNKKQKRIDFDKRHLEIKKIQLETLKQMGEIQKGDKDAKSEQIEKEQEKEE